MERNIVHLLMGAFSSGHSILWTLTYLSEKVEMSREDAVQETEASADKVEDMAGQNHHKPSHFQEVTHFACFHTCKMETAMRRGVEEVCGF